MASGDRFDYSWVDLTSEVAIASCFAFFDGLNIEEVISRAGITDWRTEDLRNAVPASAELCPNAVALFLEAGWTVAYEPNGYPERFANKVAAGADVDRCVIVFWNVNAVTEFAYWERGRQIVSFDWPQDRRGSDPDRLVADMRETVGLERTGEEGGSVFDIYQQMLALAERVTGVHLGPGFLQKPSFVVGYLDEGDDDGAGQVFDDEAAPFMPEEFGSRGSVMMPPGQSAWVGPGTGGRPEWVPEERRMNEQALDRIPKDRWTEIPARLARLACERVRIANSYPVDEILVDLDHGRRPHPAQMTIQRDIYAEVENAKYGHGAPSTEQIWAAIESVFAAARAKSRRAPLDVLLQARVAADDHGTEVIDQLRADMGLPD